MPYASLQAIREGAGLQSRVENGELSGDADGTNKVFVTERRPVVDRNNDDVVGTEDVTVYVNDLPVTVSDVNEKTGEITLAAAPVANAVVTADYCFSVLSDDEAQAKQAEADNWVDTKLSGTIAVPITGNVPGLISTAARMYAAGLILTEDSGSRADTELTSKDGFAKLKAARELIADYIAGVIAKRKATGNSTGGSNAISTTSDEDIFNRDSDDIPELSTGFTTDDEYFMRRR